MAVELATSPVAGPSSSTANAAAATTKPSHTSSSGGGAGGGTMPGIESMQSLKMFYQRFFPFKKFVEWLSYYNPNPSYFAKREFSFAIGETEDIIIRFASYENKKDFKEKLLSMKPTIPKRIDIGAVYTCAPKGRAYARPGAFKPVEKELVFDIDMTDYDDIRTCCSGGNICMKCWTFMTIAMKILHQALTEDYGFKHILWVYSGRRGVHCWVGDKRARKMTEESRKALVSYLEIIKGGEQQLRKVNLPNQMHASLTRAQKILQPYFERVVLQQQDVLGRIQDSKMRENMLGVIPDEEIRNLIRKDWEKKKEPKDMWECVKTRCLSARLPRLRNAWVEIMFQYLYPRLDAKVSMQLNHLLKAPFCVHPKTGRVCVPMDIEKCDDFDPTKVPTIGDLERALNAYDEAYPGRMDPDGKEKAMHDWKKTPLKPYIELFDQFLKGLKEERRQEEEKLVNEMVLLGDFLNSVILGI